MNLKTGNLSLMSPEPTADCFIPDSHALKMSNNPFMFEKDAESLTQQERQNEEAFMAEFMRCDGFKLDSDYLTTGSIALNHTANSASKRAGYLLPRLYSYDVPSTPNANAMYSLS